MVTKVPTMSTSGWVESISEKADRLMSYYFVSDFSQTHLYPNEICSLPYQIQQAGHDRQALQRLMSDNLQRYLGRYFESADISVRTDDINPLDPNRTQVTVNINVVENGERYNLGRLINVVNSKIAEIIDINNFGDQA